MTYALLCLPFLAVAIVLSLVTARRLPPAVRRRRGQAVGVAGAVVLVLTGVFDSVMIAAGLVQ